MAVLCEAISVIVRRDSINEFFNGGWEGFLKAIPNSTMCTDGELVRVGFMDPKYVEQFVTEIVDGGLQFKPLMDSSDELREIDDIAVIDQMNGLTGECSWVELARLPIGEEKIEVLMCWLYEGQRIASGIHMKGPSMDLYTPDGWTPQNAIKRKLH
jgi:hypothetical protein